MTARRTDYSGSDQKILDQLIEDGLFELVDLKFWRGLCQAVFRRLGLARIWQYWFIRRDMLPDRLIELADQADLIICDFPFFAFAKSFASKKPTFLLSHNLEHQIMMQEGFWHRLLVAPFIRSLEAEASKIYHKILICSDSERDFFLKHAANTEQLVILPNGVDGNLYQRNPVWRHEIREKFGFTEQYIVILFAASSYEPNRLAFEALQDFCRQNQDWLEKQGIHFLVLGSVSSRAFQQSNIHVTSFVQDAFPYFSAADAAINPVTTGSGTNVKMYEYLAAGLPIVSSPFGSRGLDLEPHDDVWLFEEDDLKAAFSQRNFDNNGFLCEGPSIIFKAEFCARKNKSFVRFDSI